MEQHNSFENIIIEIAKKCARGDEFLFEDLCQEMRLLLWQMESGNSRSYYKQACFFCAMNYIRSKRYMYTTSDKYQHISYEELIQDYDIDINGQIYEIPGDDIEEDS